MNVFDINLDIVMERVANQAAARAGDGRLAARCLELQLRRERLRARAALAAGAYLNARLQITAKGEEIRQALLELEQECEIGKSEKSAASLESKEADGEGEDAGGAPAAGGGGGGEQHKKRRLALRRSPLREHTQVGDVDFISGSLPLWSPAGGGGGGGGALFAERARELADAVMDTPLQF